MTERTRQRLGANAAAGVAIARIVAGLLAVVWTVRPVAADAWDFESDFSPTNNPKGPWSYRWQAKGTARDGDYDLLTAPVVGSGSELDVYGWSRGDLPCALRNLSATQTRGAYSPGIAPQQSCVHPGNLFLAVIRWTAPADGTFDIVYRISDENGACGDGVLWYIDRGGSRGVLASGAVPNGGDSGEHTLPRVTVVAGEAVNVVIHPRADYYCDSTRVKFAVVPAGRASRDFDLERDFILTANNDGARWSYRYKTSNVRDGDYALMTAVNDSGLPGNFMAPFWSNSGSVGKNYGQTGYISGQAVSNGWIMVHPPNPGQMSVVTWRAPEWGRINVAFRFRDLDPGCGNGVAWAVDRGADTAHGGLTLAQGAFGSGGDSGLRILTNVAVRADDRIHFVVDANGDHFCDQTRLYAVIGYTRAVGTAIAVQ